MILWLSKEYRENYHDYVQQVIKSGTTHYPLQSDELFYGLCSISRIKWIDFPDDKDFTHPMFKCKEKRELLNQVYIQRVK